MKHFLCMALVGLMWSQVYAVNGAQDAVLIGAVSGGVRLLEDGEWVNHGVDDLIQWGIEQGLVPRRTEVLKQDVFIRKVIVVRENLDGRLEQGLHSAGLNIVGDLVEVPISVLERAERQGQQLFLVEYTGGDQFRGTTKERTLGLWRSSDNSRGAAFAVRLSPGIQEIGYSSNTVAFLVAKDRHITSRFLTIMKDHGLNVLGAARVQLTRVPSCRGVYSGY